jgi:hypothetical protein
MAGKKKYTLIILSSRYAYIYSSHSYMSAANKKSAFTFYSEDALHTKFMNKVLHSILHIMCTETYKSFPAQITRPITSQLRDSSRGSISIS